MNRKFRNVFSILALGTIVSIIYYFTFYTSNIKTGFDIQDHNVYFYNNTKIKNKTASLLFDSALVLVKQSRLSEAKNAFFRADSVEPNNIIITNGIGLVYKKLGQVDSAIISFKKALTLDSAYIPTYTNYCSTLNSKERYGEAIKLLSKGLMINRDTSDKYMLYLNLAVSYSHLKKCDSAILLTTNAANNAINKKDEIKQIINQDIQRIYERCPSLPFNKKDTLSR